MQHPFEGTTPPEESAPKPECPECKSTNLVPTGPYRMHCRACNGLFKNDETLPQNNGEST